MSSSKRVLCIGINASKRDTPETRNASPPEEIQRMMSSQIQEAKDAGFNLHVELVAPDEMAEKLLYVRDLLGQEHWDGFIVGGGIRKASELTEHFEDFVNASREIRPLAKMGFNTIPGDLPAAMRRMFDN